MLLAAGGALVLLAAVLAYWTWAWFAPRAVPRMQDAVHASGRTMPAEALFGRGSAPAKLSPTGDTSFKLLGVVAPVGARAGYALLRLDSGETAVVRQGGDIAPGIRLKEVHADHVVLERRGSVESLAWPDKAAKPDTPAARMLK